LEGRGRIGFLGFSHPFFASVAGKRKEKHTSGHQDRGGGGQGELAGWGWCYNATVLWRPFPVPPSTKPAAHCDELEQGAPRSSLKNRYCNTQKRKTLVKCASCLSRKGKEQTNT